MPDPERVAITLPVEDGLPAADYVALAELAGGCRRTWPWAGSTILGCGCRAPALTTIRQPWRRISSEMVRLPLAASTASRPPP